MNGRMRFGLVVGAVLASVPGVVRAQNIQDLGRGLLNQLAPQQQPQGRGNENDAYERGRRDAEEQRRRDDDRRRVDQNDYRRNDDRRRLDVDRRPYENNGGYDNRGGNNGQRY